MSLKRVTLRERNHLTYLDLSHRGLDRYDQEVVIQTIQTALMVYEKDGEQYSMYNVENHSFLRGWTPRVAANLHALGYEVQWEAVDLRESPVDVSPAVGQLRNLQPWAVDVMSQHRYGILELATRFGKSYTYAGWYQKMGRPVTIIFVPLEKIARQMQEELSEFLGEKVGIVARSAKGEISFERLTIASDKSFFQKTEAHKLRDDVTDYMRTVECVIRDECHKFGLVGYSLYNHMPRLTWMFGGSATPTTGDQKRDLLCEGFCGPSIAQAKASLLAKYGYVAALECHWHTCAHTMSRGKFHDLYKEKIVNCDRRNAIIADICSKHRQQGQQGIVFVDRVAHGEELIEKWLPDARFVSSSTLNMTQKDEVLRAFNNKEIPVVVCTKLWREGVTFSADYAVNGEGMKASHVTVQKAGRALMPRADGSSVLWHDIFDRDGGTLEKHSQARLVCMRDEEGWPQVTH